MADKTCPLHKTPCLEHGCRWYIQLLGAHPQTGEALSTFGCAVEFLPVLLIENAKETRQAAAAIESARNAAREDTRLHGAALMELVNTMARGERLLPPIDGDGSGGDPLPPIETQGAAPRLGAARGS